METGRNISTSRTAGLVLVALTWALFLTFTGSPEALLFTVPVFLLAAPLAFGRYVGEEVIAVLRARSVLPRGNAPAGELLTLLVEPKRLSTVFGIPARGPPSFAF